MSIEFTFPACLSFSSHRTLQLCWQADVFSKRKIYNNKNKLHSDNQQNISPSVTYISTRSTSIPHGSVASSRIFLIIPEIPSRSVNNSDLQKYFHYYDLLNKQATNLLTNFLCLKYFLVLSLPIDQWNYNNQPPKIDETVELFHVETFITNFEKYLTRMIALRGFDTR